MPDRPRLHHWFRLGYVARGLVFMGLGAIAWATGRGQSSTDVVARLQMLPLGNLLLVALVAGLVGLGLFRLAEAWFDFDRRGSDPRALAERIGRAAGAIGYLAVAAATFTLLGGEPGSAEVLDAADAARQVKHWPGGGTLLILAGLATIGAAIGQGAHAWHCRFMNTLSAATPEAVRWIGRLGYAARAVIFFLIGWHLVRAGLAGHRIRDVAAVLNLLRRHVLLFRAISGGLFLFGLYSLLEARYRRMPDDEALQRHTQIGLGV